jgi:hypothetical protein
MADDADGLYALPSGEVVPGRETGQPGTPLVIRTWRAPDGGERLAVRLDTCPGYPAGLPDRRTPAARAAAWARELERRGHEVPADPCPPEEWPTIAARLAHRSPDLVEALRRILVEGRPVGWVSSTPTMRRRLQRMVGDLGWRAVHDENQ